MTLAQNAQMQAALDEFMSAVRVIPNDGPGSKVSVSNKAVSDFIDAIKSALLAEWSAGEGLDFDKAFEDAYGYPRYTSVLGAPKHEFPINEALDRQHRARLAAEREKCLTAEARVQRLEAALKSVEFDPQGYCPACTGARNHHAADCTTAAALLPEETTNG